MSLQAKVVDQNGKAVGEMDLSEKVFGVKPKTHVVFDAVLASLASRRQGTAKTKTRSEVRGGGIKPYKQKGTGNARRGSTRTPLSPGGGRVFGPRPRSYAYELPKKVSALALRVALSDAQRGGKFFVVKEFGMKVPKTKDIVGLLSGLKISKALVVDSENEKLQKSVRNLRSSKYIEVGGLNVFDMLKYQNVIMSSAAVEKVEKRLGQ